MTNGLNTTTSIMAEWWTIPPTTPKLNPAEVETSTNTCSECMRNSTLTAMTTKAPAKWREYFTAKLGCVYDDGGNQYIQYKKTRRWVYYGQSGRIKYYHRLGRVEDESKYDEAREYHI